jgi:enoyl-CoA hydratase
LLKIYEEAKNDPPQSVQGWQTESLIFTESIRLFSGKGYHVTWIDGIRKVGKMVDKDFFRYSVTERVALLTMDHPPLNILSFEYYAELCRTMIDLIEAEKANVVVLTGIRQVFISGLDIKEIGRIETPNENTHKTMAVKALFRRIEKLPRPVIAAINGNCFGGGLELAMACHLRLASRDAKLGLPEINIGTIPSFGGTQRLPKLVGRAKALDIILTGRLISGDEAASIGLVNEACLAEKLIDQAISLARQIASKNVMAVEAATQATGEALEVDIEKGGMLESQFSSGLTGTYNMKEGIAAFLEKRKPVFQDK